MYCPLSDVHVRLFSTFATSMPLSSPVTRLEARHGTPLKMDGRKKCDFNGVFIKPAPRWDSSFSDKFYDNKFCTVCCVLARFDLFAETFELRGVAWCVYWLRGSGLCILCRGQTLLTSASVHTGSLSMCLHVVHRHHCS